MAELKTRAKVMELLDQVAKLLPLASTSTGDFDEWHLPPASKDWNENHPDNKIFTWQDRFHYDWHVREKKQSTTGCNQFAGKVILKANGPNLGGINLRSTLDTLGKPYAWVPAGSGAAPKGGDVIDFGHHIGMCYTNPEIGAYRTIEGGQGGPGKGYDVVDFGKSPLSSALGWCDVDLLFGAAPADVSAPSWLEGWWTLTWSGTRYWYYFGKGGYVQYQKSAPKNAKEAVSAFSKHDGGSYTMTGGDSATVKWRITGSVEKWTRDSPTGGAEKMTGIYNNSETLYATKLA